jgi:hypothetical protein
MLTETLQETFGGCYIGTGTVNVNKKTVFFRFKRVVC